MTHKEESAGTELTAVDLIRVADLWEANQEYLRQQLGQSQSRRYGAHWVLMPESPFPRFNHVGRIRVEPEEVPGLIAECRAFFRAEGIPTYCLMVSPATRPAGLADELRNMGFRCQTEAVMVWEGGEIPPIRQPLRVEQARPDQLDLVFYLLQRVFYPGAPLETMEAGRKGVDVSAAIGAIHYIAYWENRPAGAGMLFPYASMGGVYNMATLPEFRRRGVATAVLSAILKDAQALGCEYVGLTPTLMGRPLYRRMGFRVAYHQRYYAQRV